MGVSIRDYARKPWRVPFRTGGGAPAKARPHRFKGGAGRSEDPPNHTRLSTQQKRRRVLLSNGEQLECSLLGTANTLLPTAYGIGADVQIRGKDSLAGIQGQADAAHFLGGDALWPWRNASHAQIDRLASLVRRGVMQRLFHILEDVDLNLMCHSYAPASFFTWATLSRICLRCSSLGSSCSFLSSKISKWTCWLRSRYRYK